MVEELAKKIKCLILDVDGVLTDGRIVYDNFGNELKFFNVQDGLGVYLLNRAGLKSFIITAKNTKVVKRRAKDMRITKVYSTHKKLTIYKKVLKNFRFVDEEVCFMGDDLLDLPIMKRVGMAVAVPNARAELKKIAHYITKQEGGKGAVREVVELILRARNLWEKIAGLELQGN